MTDVKVFLGQPASETMKRDEKEQNYSVIYIYIYIYVCVCVCVCVTIQLSLNIVLMSKNSSIWNNSVKHKHAV